jgi:hypothetical protein
MDRKLRVAIDVAKKKNIVNWQTIAIADAKNKRFSIISPAGRKINFGVWPYSGEGTYIDHNDEKIRKAWQARHKMIMKDGKPAYLNKESPEFYSWHILW